MSSSEVDKITQPAFRVDVNLHEFLKNSSERASAVADLNVGEGLPDPVYPQRPEVMWETDRAFHNLGVGWDAASKRYTDEGRGAITGRSGDRGAFKTPTLRDVARHPPYMHDGSLPTLRDVILFYERGGVRTPHLDTQLRPLRLFSKFFLGE